MNFNLDLLITVPQIVAFDYLMQPALVKTWVEEVKAFDLVGTNAKPVLGAPFQQTVVHGGAKRDVAGTIEAFDPPDELSVLVREKNYELLTVYRLRPNELGTLMRVITRFYPKDGLTKRLGMWAAKRHRKQFLRNLQHMKAQWETAYAAQSPPQRRVATSAGLFPDEPRLDPAAKSANLP